MRSADYPRAQRPAMTTPPRTPRREPEKKELQMPEQSEQTGRLFAYLCQTRKIPPHIVEELLHTGLLYQSENTVHCERDGQQKTFHNANAVFVHRDTTGNAIGAEIQGLNSFKGKRLSMKSLYSTETVRHRPADQNAENRQSNYWNAICGTSSGVIQIFMFSMRYFIWTNQEAFEQDFDHYDKDNWLDALPEELSEALKRFPKEQLHAFFLNRVEGYTQQEIAAMMSISQPTAFRLIGEIHEIISSVNKTGVLTGCIIEGDEKNASQNLEN